MQVKITLSQDDTTRALVKFDQAAIAAAVGAGTLRSASLELGIEQSGTDPLGNDLDVHRLLKPWTEAGVTWRCGEDLNTANVTADCPKTKWRMSGPDMDAHVANRSARAHLSPGQSGYALFDVTADVQAYLAGAANHGWLVNAGSPTSRAVVWSRESQSHPRLVLAVAEASVPSQAPDAEPASLYDPSKMVPIAPNSRTKMVRDAISILFKEGTSAAERAAVVSRLQGTVIGGTPITETDGFYIVRMPDPGSIDSVERIIASLDTTQTVDLALPEYITDELGQYRIPDDGEFFTKSDFGIYPADARGKPWYLTAVNAPLAWGCSTGGDDIPIAVVDEGLFFFSDIPDLTPALSFRTNKYPGSQHGIKTASILAAGGSNHQGMTGMMWSSNLRLYDIVQLDPQTGEPNIDPATRRAARNPRATANRISQAIRDGARVINLSLGVPAPIGTPTPDDIVNAKRWAAAVQKTWARFPPASRPLLVIAAGNDGLDAWWSSYPQLESSFPNDVLVVAGSNRASNALFENSGMKSNFGSLVSVAAPGEEMVGFDGTGTLVPFGLTSGAVPLVSGLAGLLLAFDPRLTTRDLHDLIIAGAKNSGRSAGSIPIMDAYGSLKLAAQRDGAPLCGNRVWAQGSILKTQRSTGTKDLLGISPLASFLNVFHGGRRVDWVDRDYVTHSAIFDGVIWKEGTGASDDAPGGSYHSLGPNDNWMYSASHDGDLRIRANYMYITTQNVQIQLQISRDGGDTFTDTLPPYFESGVDNTTPECSYRIGRWNGLTGEFIRYDCQTTVSAGYYQGVAANSYFYPGGKKALLVILRGDGTTTLLTGLEKCPWAAVDRGINTEECRSVRQAGGSQWANLYEVDLSTGARTPVLSVSGRTVAIAAVSEADDEAMLIELKQSGGYDFVPKDGPTPAWEYINTFSSTTDCQAAWYPLNGAAQPFRVSSQDFCDIGFEGGGTMASVHRKDASGTVPTSSTPRRPPLGTWALK